ncbi:DUF596 domain-containing protein [Klebsiella sp. I138]|uniref:DUF596 domain-containing protein n=1 Tax=Klebsiella sp. I138 TaxID=2755385 RepID=UPI003DA83312
MAIDALWGVSCPNEDIGNVQFPFEEKRTYFFELLERFMTEGKVRIGKHGKFLDGSIEEQISRYRMAFPKTEDEWKKRNEEIWFYEEDCPGGIVWIHENGYEDWT